MASHYKGGSSKGATGGVRSLNNGGPNFTGDKHVSKGYPSPNSPYKGNGGSGSGLHKNGSK